MKSYRKYQQEADDAITKCLLVEDKCLAKMFCGTGKSLIMRNVKAIKGKKMVAWVFPTIALSTQFHDEYLNDVSRESILMVSSSDESSASTDPEKIKKFLKRKSCKYICVTYQSFGLFVNCLGGTKIDLCMFDEAHHVCGHESQKLIFEENHCLKQVFFTATPKNANGIIMYGEEGMCGPLVYDYSYLDGKCEGVLNGFDIRIDMYSENTNKSIYDSIARAILTTGNNRVLTFHTNVGEAYGNTSVESFAKEELFQEAFQNVLEEFPEKVGFYQSIKMRAMTSSIPNSKRTSMLKEFDETPGDEIYILCSCETIGEGIDTKKANMCVFVDPKSSFVKIIQNIGRIVRKPEGVVNNATILIPCWVDREKYLECEGDPEKVDEVIRSEMNTGGNFNGILNVLSALKQEDEDLFDACLRYPDVFSPQEISRNLKRQGLEELESVGSLEENLSHVIGKEVEFDEESDEENLERIAKENKVCVEIHTNSLETPIETYNPEAKKIVRLLKTEGEEGDEYCPVVKKNPKAKDVPSEPPSRNRNKIEVHTNPDIRVLWNFVGVDLSKRFCSCVIDCEVIDMWFERLEELKKFIDENGRRPLQEKEEKLLGIWTSRQIRNHKQKLQGMKKQERYNCWSIFLEQYKEYFIENDEKWLQRLELVKAFIEEFKKRPTICSIDENEKKIGKWLDHNLMHYKKKTSGMKDEIRYEIWCEFLDKYKEYFISNFEKWYSNLSEVKNFIDKKERKPHTTGDEGKLCRWIYTQTENYKKREGVMSDIMYYNLWNDFLEEYQEYFTNTEDTWNETFNKLKLFIEGKKRKPDGSVYDKEERSLGQWWVAQQSYHKKKSGGMKNTFRYNLWSDFLEEFKEHFKNGEEVWYSKLEELKIFINENGRRPTAASSEEIERKMGYWITDQIIKYKQKYGIFKEITHYNAMNVFLMEYDEYFTNTDDIWMTTFNDVKIFIDREKKRPNARSDNEKEKKMGYWVSNQCSRYKNKTGIMKNENLYKLYTRFLEKYKEYFRSDEEVWQSKFKELTTFLDENGKRPKKRSNNEKEKELGVWITTQLGHYRKKNAGMKDETRYNLWTEFMKEYSHIFDVSETASESGSVEDEIITNPKKNMKLNPKKEKESEQKRQRVKTEISELHQKYKTMRSDNLASHFAENPEDWHHYHAISEKNEESFPEEEIPRNRIIRELALVKTGRPKVVVDAGCGRAQIAQHFAGDKRFMFYNYDHVAYHPSVISHDISRLPHEDMTVDFVILSLAMWGSNCREYISEARRVLDGGFLYIIEPTKRWTDDEPADRLRHLLKEYGFQIVEESVEKFCFFKCL